MSPKHSDKLPAPSSSDEEEDTTSEAEEEEEEEDETSDEELEQSQSQIPLSQKTPQIKKPDISSSTLATEANESSESDGSESETDSDSAVPVIKPLATKPMVDDAKKQQSAAKPSASGAKSKAKRPAESNSKPESKRSKKEPENGREEKQKESSKAKNDSEDGEEKGKKILFQRIWSEEDEIALLKGMIEFSKRGTDPATDLNAFHEFIKSSLHMDFGIAKLKDKMMRLKKKYKNHVKRGKGDVFSKAHEQEAYNLSKRIWTADDEVLKSETPAQSNGKAKKSLHLSAVRAIPEASNKEMIVTKLDILPLDKRIGVGSIEEEVLSNGLNFITGEKKASLEKRWKKLRIAEMELFLQRNELVSEQAKLMLDFYESGKN